MARQASRPRGLPPSALAALTVIGLTVAGVAAIGGLKPRENGDEPPAKQGATRASDAEPVDPFASLPREEPRTGHRQATTDHEPRPMPVIDGEGWAAALEAGRLADEQLERAKDLRGHADLETYKTAAREAKALYQQALELGAPVLDALGEDAAGTGVERRMSRWTSSLIALKKTTGL